MVLVKRNGLPRLSVSGGTIKNIKSQDRKNWENKFHVDAVTSLIGTYDVVRVGI